MTYFLPRIGLILKKLLTVLATFLPLICFSQQFFSIDTSYLSNDLEFSIKSYITDDQFMTLDCTIDDHQQLIDSLEYKPLAEIKIVTFNSDDYPDILIEYLGNNPVYQLYIFSLKRSEFVKIKDYFRFPHSNPVPDAKNLFYSYHRAGCADLVWVSDLWMLDNFQIKHLAHLYAQGCDWQIEQNPQYIEVSRVINNDENNLELIENLPLQKALYGFSDKHEFLQHYWTELLLKYKI